jgi:hypothetical protein
MPCRLQPLPEASVKPSWRTIGLRSAGLNEHHTLWFVPIASLCMVQNKRGRLLIYESRGHTPTGAKPEDPLAPS